MKSVGQLVLEEYPQSAQTQPRANSPFQRSYRASHPLQDVMLISVFHGILSSRTPSCKKPSRLFGLTGLIPNESRTGLFIQRTQQRE